MENDIQLLKNFLEEQEEVMNSIQDDIFDWTPKSENEESFQRIIYAGDNISFYNGNHCWFQVNLSNSDVKRLRLFTFCLGYMLNSLESFSFQKMYRGFFQIFKDTENSYLIESNFKVWEQKKDILGSGIGTIEMTEDCLQISYCVHTSDENSSSFDYRYQIESLNEGMLLHVIDQKKRVLLESFLLENVSNMNEIPVEKLEQNKLKGIFQTRR